MALRWLAAAVLFVFINGNIHGQEDAQIKKGAFKTGVEIGFKEAWKSIQEGDESYEAGVGTYDMARDHYLFAHQYNPENATLNYKLGVCYLFTDNKYEAINYFQKAYILDPEVSEDIELLMARAYQLVLEFDLAIKHYNAYHLQLAGTKEGAAFTPKLNRYLEECENGKELVKEPVRVILQNLGEGVNSRYDDYNPVFAFQDTALFFTSRRPFEKSKRNPIDNKFNEDIYRSTFTGETFERAVRLPEPFNSESNDALVGMNFNGSRMMLYRGSVEGGDIRISDYQAEKSKWTRPKSVKNKLTSRDGETSACLSPDGKTIYYISMNTKLSYGGKDILMSTRNQKGKWTEPRNVGSEINTPLDEEGVYVTPDGKSLFFASKGHNSMGGFDVFRAEMQPDGSWANPVNLGFPINTADDEVFYIADGTGTYGYYSTVRDGGFGARDLYKVVFLGSEKELIFRTEDQLVAGMGPVKMGFLTRPELLVLDTSIVMTGVVADTVDGMIPLQARLVFIDISTGEPEVITNTDTSGHYIAQLPGAMLYAVEINASDYLFYNDIFDLSSENGDEELHRDFFLKKVEVGTKVVLDNIYFETGKAVLAPESNEALDQVLRFLENNPTMKLEISGHTDNTGSLRINQRLSRDRAKSVVTYLTDKGISEEQLVFEGYADTQPVAENDNPEGREQNRRVEFKVLSK
jgi:outer membrane protein OmpA-like peptidoglycan-associated protein/tetratricopeptide (TPR) repeat protein